MDKSLIAMVVVMIRVLPVSSWGFGLSSLMLGPCPIYAGESGFYVGKGSYSE
jgi:hypothetical protein